MLNIPTFVTAKLATTHRAAMNRVRVCCLSEQNKKSAGEGLEYIFSNTKGLKPQCMSCGDDSLERRANLKLLGRSLGICKARGEQKSTVNT